MTKNEIKMLERVTAVRCPVTPSLLAVKIEAQDESLLNAEDRPELQYNWDNVKWWIPGGYVVYILMTKLPGQSLVTFWDEGVFTLQERKQIRESFKKVFMLVDIDVFFHSTYKLAGKSSSWTFILMTIN